MTPTVGQIRRELAILRESKIKAGVNPNVALNDARRQMNQKYGYKMILKISLLFFQLMN